MAPLTLLTLPYLIGQVVEEHVVALKEEVMAVFEAMPRDLQHTVLSSPGRANLLHRLCHLHPKANSLHPGTGCCCNGTVSALPVSADLLLRMHPQLQLRVVS